MGNSFLSGVTTGPETVPSGRLPGRCLGVRGKKELTGYGQAAGGYFVTHLHFHQVHAHSQVSPGYFEVVKARALLGVQQGADPAALIPNSRLTLDEGAIATWPSFATNPLFASAIVAMSTGPR